MIKWKFKYTSYEIYRILAVMMWNLGTLVSFFRSFLLRIPVLGKPAFVHLLMASIYIFLIVLSFRYLISKIKFTDILFYFIICSVYVIGIFNGQRNSEYLTSMAVTILLRCVPLYFIGVSFNLQDEKLIDLFYITSVISIYFNILYLMLLGRSSLTTGADNMALAYRLLPHVCLVIYYNVIKPKTYGIITIVIGFVMLTIFGTRGAFLLSGSFLVMCLTILKKHKHKVLFFFTVVVLLGVIFAYYTAILTWLSEVFGSLGFRTRIFDRILQASFLQSVDRDNISFRLMKYIDEGPWYGYGIAGDRILLGGKWYAHNYLLELWVSYGRIIGTALIVLHVLLLLHAVRACGENKNIWALVLALIFGNGFLKLFVSSSYLIEAQFFWLIGLCICVYRENPIKVRIFRKNYVR